MSNEHKDHECTGCGSQDCERGAVSPGRRRFLGAVVGVINLGIVAVVGGPVLGFLGAPMAHSPKREWLDVADLDALPADGAVEVTYTLRVVDGYHMVDRDYSVFLRRDGGQVLCIDPACTHLGCRVTYQPEHDRFLCPCHGGVFDEVGAVVSGPPPRHLDRHETKVEAGRVYLLREV